MNCVIVSSKYIDSISVLYLSCFICYKLLQLLKYAHIFSVYTKMRLFKSQKTTGDRAKLFINWIQHTQIKKNPAIPILASDQKSNLLNSSMIRGFWNFLFLNDNKTENVINFLCLLFEMMLRARSIRGLFNGNAILIEER